MKAFILIEFRIAKNTTAQQFTIQTERKASRVSFNKTFRRAQLWRTNRAV